MNVLNFQKMKDEGKKIAMLTCYDYAFATIVDSTDIDCVLVGDTLASVMHGHRYTTSCNIDMMALHVAAVARGTKKFLIGDMPFLSYRKSLDSNMAAVYKLVQAGSNAVKLEGSKGNLELITHIVESGVPVMGHIGLTPQSVHGMGGYRVQGKEEKAAADLLKQAQDLQKAGCFAIVLECVPADLAAKITAQLTIPTIGIGAGVECDGQVLVLQDMLGMHKDLKLTFLKQYMDGFNMIQGAVNEYASDVKAEKFPTKQHSF